jgi:hypothetical protein
MEMDQKINLISCVSKRLVYFRRYVFISYSKYVFQKGFCTFVGTYYRTFLKYICHVSDNSELFELRVIYLEWAKKYCACAARVRMRNTVLCMRSSLSLDLRSSAGCGHLLNDPTKRKKQCKS